MRPIDNSLFPKFTSTIEKLQEWAHDQLWVYDIETYPNFFSLAIINAKTLQCYYFELSPWYNNMKALEAFMYYLNHYQAEMVGYNNQHFDFPVIDFVFRRIPYGITNEMIYAKVESIFGAPFDERFKHVIWGDKQFVKQIDLFKINHYDNVAKSTSLKMLENNMGMENIQELPIQPGQLITLEDRDNMYRYNWHDVAATLLFLAHNTEAIDLRRELAVKFDHDFTNASESKIGGDIFKIKLREAGLPVDKKTFRSFIKFDDCIFPYVQFERPEFKAVLSWLKSTTIEKTKKALNDIDVPWGLAQYMNPDEVVVHGLEDEVLRSMKLRKGAKVKLSLVPPGTSLVGCVFIADHLHCVVDGFQFDFGTGGIHGSISSSIVKTTSTHKLIDVDVASYYPNLGIKNQLYPEHLGTAFCDTYDGLYQMRQNEYPKKKFPKLNKAIKLCLNSAYGNSNSQYSFLYDPKYTMTITLNGQLLLCMLSEHLLKVPGLSLIQINTDGVTYLCPNEYVQHTMGLCRWWEKMSQGLELEDVEYKTMYIRDVNNYIAVDNRGDIKYKGAYEYNLAETGQWHKNFNCRIVAMAAEAALLHDTPVEQFIHSHYRKDEHRELFCMRSKCDRNSRIVLNKDGVDTELQRITRYHASYDGGELVKIMPPTPAQIELYKTGDHYQHETTGVYEVKKQGVKPTSGMFKPVPTHIRREAPDRRERLEATCSVRPCNKLSDFDWDALNIEYYIEEASKLVAPLLQ